MKAFAILLLFVSGVAQAQTITAVDVSGLQGTYLLKVDAGAATVTPLTLLKPSPIPSPNPNPNPNPNPGPGPVTPFEKVVADLTSQAIKAGGTSTTAAGISSVYSLASDSVANGSIPVESALTAVGVGVRLVLLQQNEGAKWEAFRTSVSAAFDTLRQDGSLKTKEQYAKAFREVANGMNSVTGFNGSAQSPAQQFAPSERLFENIDIAKIIELIKLLMELFKMFKPI